MIIEEEFNAGLYSSEWSIWFLSINYQLHLVLDWVVFHKTAKWVKITTTALFYCRCDILRGIVLQEKNSWNGSINFLPILFPMIEIARGWGLQTFLIIISVFCSRTPRPRRPQDRD